VSFNNNSNISSHLQCRKSEKVNRGFPATSVDIPVSNMSENSFDPLGLNGKAIEPLALRKLETREASTNKSLAAEDAIHHRVIFRDALAGASKETCGCTLRGLKGREKSRLVQSSRARTLSRKPRS